MADQSSQEKTLAQKRRWRYVLKWLWIQSQGSRLGIGMVALAGLLRVGASLSFVWVSKTLVDIATGQQAGQERQMLYYSILLASLLVVEMLLSLGASYIASHTEARMKNRMRKNLYSHLMCSGRGEGKRMHSGDILNRLSEDVRVVTDAVCQSSADIIVMVAQLVGAFIMLYAMSPTLALCAVGIMPLFLLLSKAYVRKMRALTTDIRKGEAGIQTSMQEGLQHHAAVQTLECEPQMLDRLGGLQAIFFGQVMRRARYNTFSRAMIRLGFMSGFLTAFIWSVWHLHTGAITYGMMTAFLQLVARLQNPMSNLVRSVSPFIYALSSSDRLIELEQFPAEDKSHPVLLPKPVGIRARDVHFSYSDGDNSVLANFDYDFKPGSKTIVMGPTGSGKSTLARLILALLKPQQGKIELYSGSKAVDASPATRCNMVYVPQGNSLLEGTVRDNLLLGKPDATADELKEALHTAVADFVYDLPNGLDTKCGEMGSGLSEGQAQRVAIARALLRDGGVMLLDEFNSALDPDTASTLMERLCAQRSDCTIIFISHRPEVATYCDGILQF